MRQEQRAALDRTNTERARVKEVARLAREQAREAAAAQRQAAREHERQARLQVQAQREALAQQRRAQREATRERIAEIRSEALAQRQGLQDQITAQQRAVASLRASMRDVRRDMTNTRRSTDDLFASAGSGFKKMGSWFHEVGVSITEAGNLLSTKFLAPLTLAGSALTTIGVNSADKRLLGQLGLSAAGVSKDASAKQMYDMQMYAIDTPFSIDVMHEYQMKLIRSIAGTDKDWFKTGDARTEAANKAAAKTTDLIMAVGDSMARAGNLDPSQFQRAMYAMDHMMDMDRAPTKNVKQLIAASGMPASEMAQLLGFDNAGEMWKVIGTPTAKGGGVSGERIMDAMLNTWDPKKYPAMGGYGNREAAPSRGYAEQMTTETITGRVQQLKERATFELGNLFVKEDSEGAYRYTRLGETLMGKDTYTYDAKDRITGRDHEDGPIDTVGAMAKKYAPDVEKFLSVFLESVRTFVTTLDGITSWLRDNKQLVQLTTGIGTFLLEWGPLILAAGLLAKLFGKLAKVVGMALTPVGASVRGIARGAQGAGRTAGQVREGRAAAREARSNGATRSEARRAGRAAYRQQRAENRQGDARGLGARARDAVTGTNTNYQNQLRQLREMEEQIRAAEQRTAELRDELRGVDRTSMRAIQDSMRALGRNLAAGNGSVRGSANSASSAVQGLNQARLTQARQSLESVKTKADDTAKAVKAISQEVRTLDSRKLGSLRAQQIETTTKRADDLRKAVTRSGDAVAALNGKSLSGLRGQHQNVTKSADATTKAVKTASAAMETLKGKTLRSLRDWVDRLTSSATNAYTAVGTKTGASSLNGRVKTLSDQSMSRLNGTLKTLGDRLERAKKEAQSLNSSLGEISKRSPGGSNGSGKGGSKKKARGGVIRKAEGGIVPGLGGILPGYKPWVDSVPAILSPGESVLRPEVTNALGEETINQWNGAAIRGQLSRNARGGVVGGKGSTLASIRDYISLYDVGPIGIAAGRTMALDAASDPIGGPTQQGILGTGDTAARGLGSQTATKYKGMYDFLSDDLWGLLRKAPTGVSQLVGTIAGIMGPIQGEYLWDDVWKGNGNILSRGKKYLSDVFSTKTLGRIWDNTAGGVWESLSSLWKNGKAIAADPIGYVQDSISGVYDTARDSYNGLVGMVDAVREIRDSPKDYAARVFSEHMEAAREAMPNTKGLFDFKKGSKVTGSLPEAATGMVSPSKTGSAVTRWAPVAQQAMGMLDIAKNYLSTVLHRIGVESGGNPNIVNKWDSNWISGHPSVGLMQVIGPTYGAYAGPFRGTGPFSYGTSTNPLANIYAGLNYARSRYGSRWASVLSGTTGYATGTLSASPGLHLVGEQGRELVDFGGGGARVYNNRETESILDSKKYEIHIHEARNEPTPNAVLRALQTAEALYTNL
ncbi:transglycosylase SLT domain-containing protein [Streptomyces sp. NPDC087850]|uniref:transglycosylase SLT domain-containing protein n=1 Tax=Streptomyces sp. NPDC087850 TaxID=3365809 RepID=UPI003812404F